MLQINQLKVPIDAEDDRLAIQSALCKKLKIKSSDILSFEIRKRSIDARKKPDLFYSFVILLQVNEELEIRILKQNQKNSDVNKFSPVNYKIPTANRSLPLAPVVIGAGPGGLFAAYILALAGLKPRIYERGESIESRQKTVEAFWETGILNPKSNVQFGEGGAGAFSDGKLNTLVKDSFGRNRFVLETFVKFGADPEILYDPKPHVGTDVLLTVVSNLRKEIESLGGEFHFHSQITDFTFSNGKIQSITVNGADKIAAEQVILAIGHSARDTFQTLYDAKVDMKAKEFAVGFRVEHPQEMISKTQYGILSEKLPPAAYKLAYTRPDGRGVYSFCMCPGGFVVNSSSEEERMTVNGMSYADRGSKNANSAIVVSVGEKEFDMSDPLSGVRFQREIEEKAYSLCHGRIPQQLLCDFEKNQLSLSYGSFTSEVKGATEFANLREILPEELNLCFLEGLRVFQDKIKGFYREDAILSGVESRTSSPVRISRDEAFMSNYYGLYPCGEGAGYAGGIMSAAMDGMKCAEKILENNNL